MKFSKKQRSTITYFIYFLVTIVISILIHSSAPFQYYILLFYILFPILTFIYEEDFGIMLSLVMSVLAVLSLFIFLLLWLFQAPVLNKIPLFQNGISNDIIIAFFTVILTVSTVINLVIYRKSIVLSRLTSLNAILDYCFSLKIKNIGEYPATRIKVSVDIRKKPKLQKLEYKYFKNLINRNVWLKFWNKIKLQFWISEESDIQYLEPKELSNSIDIYPLIKKYFREIKERKNERDEREIFSDTEKKFKVIVIMHFYNDTGDKAPVPALRIFKIKVDKIGVQFE